MINRQRGLGGIRVPQAGELLFFSAVLSLILSVPTFAKPIPVKTAIKPPQTSLKPEESSFDNSRERHDRRVDVVALQSKERAIAQLQKLIVKYHGTPQEGVMMFKLAKFQEQVSGIHFRTSYAQGEGGPGKIDETYTRSLEDVIKTSHTIMDQFPKLTELDQVYFMSALAFENLNKKDEARKAYLEILSRFPKSDLLPHANMALAEFEIQAEHYQESLKYLSAVEKMPDDSHYPFAIYKMAWSYFNLKDLPKAMSYLVRNVAYYKKKAIKDPKVPLSTSDQALLDHSLIDVAVFYLEGFETKLPDYTNKNVLATFRKIETGPSFGMMALRYARLLRAHDHDEDLLALQDQMVNEEKERSETLNIILISFEYFFNQRNYTKMLEIADYFKKLDTSTHHRMRKFESYSAAQHSLLDTADKLQKTIMKNVASDESQLVKYVRALKGVYQAYIGIVDEKDPSVPLVHYNLAEMLFSIKEYAESTDNYRWVLDHWNNKTKFVKMDIRLKMISSRYQDLYKNGYIPKAMQPTILPKGGKDPDQKLDPNLVEWVAWLDSYNDDFSGNQADYENFEFEANRTLYVQHHMYQAIDRFYKFSENHLESKFFIPSVKLVLDTYIVSEMWEAVLRAADHFNSIYKKAKIPNAEFTQKLVQVGSDAFYKLIETSYKQKKYELALKQVDDFKDKFTATPRLSDVLFLASRVAMDAKLSEKAVGYLTELLTKFPTSENFSAALLVRASLEEQRYDFNAALTDYSQYLSQASKQTKHPELQGASLQTISKKLFLMKYLGPKPDLASCKEFEKDSDLIEECEHYQILTYFKFPKLQLAPDIVPSERAHKGIKVNRPLWAALALQREAGISLHDQLLFGRLVVQNWDNFDTISQFALVSMMMDTLPQMLFNVRKALPHESPLRVNSTSIERRIEWMSDIEKTATQIVKLPWARIKVTVLGQVASMYLDFAKELESLPIPKKFSEGDRSAYEKSVREVLKPFQKKGEMLYTQAITVGTESAVERSVIEGLLDPKTKRALAVPLVPLDLHFVEAFDPGKNWSSLSLNHAVFDMDRLEALWAESFKARDLGRMAYFIQELSAKAGLKPNVLGLLRAASLDVLGAQSEALGEVEAAKSAYDQPTQMKLNSILYGYYINSFSDKRAAAVKPVLPQKAEKQKK